MNDLDAAKRMVARRYAYSAHLRRRPVEQLAVFDDSCAAPRVEAFDTYRTQLLISSYGEALQAAWDEHAMMHL